MGIKRLNHAVLYVRDADRSAAFYRDVLDFREVGRMPGGVFLQAPNSTNDHDLGLFSIGNGAERSGAGRTSVGLYHLAWEVFTLADLQRVEKRLASAGALVGRSDHVVSKSLYAQDLDGLEFEVCWLVPTEHVDPDTNVGRPLPLDIEAEIGRFGAATVGGR